MKIIFLAHCPEMYGANLSLYNLIIQLKKKYKIEPVVVVNGKGELSDHLKKEHIRVYILSYWTSYVTLNKGHVRLRKTVKLFLRIPTYFIVYLKLRKENNVSFIHSNSSVIDLGYYLSRWMKIPHIWHIREFGEEDYNLSPIDDRRSLQKKYMATEWIVAISGEIERKVRSIAGKCNLVSISNGVIIPAEYRKKPSNDTVRFCAIGKIHKGKNQLEIVKACKELSRQQNENYHLTLIGDGDEAYISQIRKYIDENALGENITLTGYVRNAADLLCSYDVGIISSVKEAFGRVTVEYMANYMPVIGTDSGGTKELIREGINGFLYSYGDCMQLSKCMEYFICNRDKILEMGSKARKVSLEYSVEKNADKIYELYRSNLANGKKQKKQS